MHVFTYLWAAHIDCRPQSWDLEMNRMDLFFKELWSREGTGHAKQHHQTHRERCARLEGEEVPTLLGGRGREGTGPV